MKNNQFLILFLLLIVAVSVYSQDTISRVNSSCIKLDLRSVESSTYNFTLISDSIIITKRIEANCASIHSAIIKRYQDSIVIDIIDSGGAATCYCMFDIRVGLKTTPADTLIIINKEIFNISYLFSGISMNSINDDAFDVIYDTDNDCLRVLEKSYMRLNGYEIYDDLGRLQISMAKDRKAVDMSGFKTGIYFVKFLMVDNKQLIKRFIKN